MEDDIDYFKINESKMYKFYQIPKELFENELYKSNLNSDSKILYGFLLDRLALSKINKWYDKNGNIYLIFTREKVQGLLNLSDKTVTKAFKQLADAKLIKEKRQGLGKPNLIYVGKIKVQNLNEYIKEPFNNRNFYDSEVVKISGRESDNLRTINTNNINTNINTVFSKKNKLDIRVNNRNYTEEFLEQFYDNI